MIECCAIAHYPNATQWFPFVYCLEASLPNLLECARRHAAWPPRVDSHAGRRNVQACATKAGLDYNVINKCFTYVRLASARARVRRARRRVCVRVCVCVCVCVCVSNRGGAQGPGGVHRRARGRG
jgi:hypothetical protein